MPIPVILDCAPGHDDAMAILLAVASPAIDLRAVTTVAGNQTVDKTALDARRMLSLAGATGVPVAAGCDRPLTAPLEIGDYVHGESGLDGRAFGEPSVPLDARHGVDPIHDTLAAAGEPVTVVAIGPLTDIATLLRRHPGDRDPPSPRWTPPPRATPSPVPWVRPSRRGSTPPRPSAGDGGGALATTRPGAGPSLPDREEVDDLLDAVAEGAR